VTHPPFQWLQTNRAEAGHPTERLLPSAYLRPFEGPAPLVRWGIHGGGQREGEEVQKRLVMVMVGGIPFQICFVM